MDVELLAAYRRTEYRVDDAGHAFVLRIDVPSAELRRCHELFGMSCSAFLTAWNPRSTPTSREQNDVAMSRLEEALTALGCRWLKGEAEPPRVRHRRARRRRTRESLRPECNRLERRRRDPTAGPGVMSPYLR